MKVNNARYLQSLDRLITSSIQANKFGNNIQALEYFKKFEIKKMKP